MLGEIGGHRMEDGDERFIGALFAKIFPPMGNQHGALPPMDLLYYLLQHGAIIPEAGEQATWMREQQRLAYLPMGSAAQFLQSVFRPPPHGQAPQLIPTAREH